MFFVAKLLLTDFAALSVEAARVSRFAKLVAAGNFQPIDFANAEIGQDVVVQWQRLGAISGVAYSDLHWCDAEIESKKEDEVCVSFSGGWKNILTCPRPGVFECKKWESVRAVAEENDDDNGDQPSNAQDAVCDEAVEGSVARKGSWDQWCRCKHDHFVTGEGEQCRAQNGTHTFDPDEVRGCRCSDCSHLEGVTTATTTRIKRTLKSRKRAQTTVNYFGSGHPPLDGGNSNQVAAYMNHLYFGFDSNDDSSPLGVHITMLNSFTWFCGESCHRGWADCRLSASLYNHKMMLKEKTTRIKLTMNRAAGIALNQQKVESEWRKCSYMWDGASFNRYNGACGCAARSHDCDNPKSAFQNKCDGENQCQVDHKYINKCTCDTKLVTSSMAAQCIWKGTAFDPEEINSNLDQTRQMVKTRLQHSDKYEGKHYNEEYWNEIIIDTGNWSDTLVKEPESMVLAFVYLAKHSGGRRMAKRMQKKFVETYKPSFAPPLIAVDTMADTSAKQPVFLAGVP